MNLNFKNIISFSSWHEERSVKCKYILKGMEVILDKHETISSKYTIMIMSAVNVGVTVLAF